MFFTKYAVLLSLLFCTSSLYAQTTSRRWEAGLGGGLAVYQGDLATSRFGSVKTPGATVQFFGSYILSPSVSLRGAVAFATLKADDATYAKTEVNRQRNFSFQSDLTELSVQLHWNFLKDALQEQFKTFSPYLFAGAGKSIVTYQKRNTPIINRINNPWVARGWRIDSTVARPTNINMLVIGGGLRYYLTSSISLFTEAGQRFTNNDYIDGYSHAANPKQKDYYTTFVVGLIYRFGYKDKFGCPQLN